MGTGSKPASFASSFAIQFLAASSFIVQPGAFLYFDLPTRCLLGSPGDVVTNRRHPRCNCSPFDPRDIPGTVKLCESPRQSRGVSPWTKQAFRRRVSPPKSLSAFPRPTAA